MGGFGAVLRNIVLKPWFLGSLITLVITGTYLSGESMVSQVMQRLDFVVFDFRYRVANPTKDATKHPIVIVDVDEKSLKAEGRWPWSRAKMRDLLASIYDSGAVMVGMDIVFAEAETNPVDIILSEKDSLLESGVLSSEAEQVLRSLRPRYAWDEQFGASLGDDTVLGYFFYRQRGAASGVLPAPLQDVSRRQQLTVTSMQGYSGNIPLLQGEALSAGYLTVLPDADGVVRRAPLVLQYEGGLYSSLALEMVRQFIFSEQVTLVTAMQHEAEVTEGVRFDRYFAPTDAIGQAIIPYVGGRGSFPYVSATDVLHGEEGKALLEGAIVLIGTSAWGLGDLKATPLSPQYPGVEVHANLINGLLNSQGDARAFPHRPDLSRYITVLAMLVTGVFLVMVLTRMSPAGLIVVSALVLVGVVGINIYLWAEFWLDFPLAPHLLLTITLTIYFFSDSMLRENFQRLQIKKMFGQYVPAEHVERMINSDENFSFDGESKTMSVMFCDIRDFTAMSEGLSAVDLKIMLNQFFTPITRIIFGNEGTVDKYVGDMVMAFWGAPLDDVGHAEHSVRSGLEMLKKVEELKPEFAELGLPEINIGIGINTGVMNVGDMGSEYRRAYTVLGDAVNLGSRLESVTKFYGVKFLVGEKTQALASSFQYRLIDRIRVKGKTQPVTVYEPVGEIDEVSGVDVERIARFHMALFHYYYQQWDKALAVLALLHHDAPDKIYDIYRERIEMLKNEPLSEDWDGVFVHEVK